MPDSIKRQVSGLFSPFLDMHKIIIFFDNMPYMPHYLKTGGLGCTDAFPAVYILVVRPNCLSLIIKGVLSVMTTSSKLDLMFKC